MRPQCPLLGSVPLVPEIHPNLAEVVLATVLIYIIDSFFVDFLCGKVGSFGVIHWNCGMLMKVNPKLLNNYPTVFNWAENWAVNLPERGGVRPNWNSYVTCLEDEDRWAACFHLIVLVNSLLDRIAHSRILNMNP